MDKDRFIPFIAVLIMLGGIIWYIAEVISYIIKGDWGAVIAYTIVPAALIIIYLSLKDANIL